ncbi:hypothetical protein [Janibacter terrae]|uniref:hypothetical protein n=1 Tax=Janibacter terrae TaxID=103817 RepID=UPI000A897F4A|nr:hypothetical protein [Janibacter terrae]
MKRGLFDHVADYLSVPDHDAVIVQALGLLAAGAFLALYGALRLLPKKIGASA